MFEYKITAQDGKARVGELVTPHGTIATPVFMPVGTHGAVKSVSPAELSRVGSQVILSNTYHLYLRPGEKTVRGLGGLHGFMNWSGPILTDSGGFQVFSLGERGMTGQTKKALRKVSEEGILFQSHLDGSSHLFTPEKSIAIQQDLGADIIMAFDQPVYGMSAFLAAQEAMQRTKRWLARSREQWQKGSVLTQALFGIVQGGTHKELHQESAEYTASLDLPGNAIGGLAVGEGKAEMWEAVSSINAILPETKPRYFMGLGEPLDLIEATARGVDMYDCVAPSRLARHGVVWQVQGEPPAVEAFYTKNTQALLERGLPISFGRLNLHNNRFKEDPTPLVGCPNDLPEDLQGFSKGSLYQYVKNSEMLGFRILTLHNIEILHLITFHMRQAVSESRFVELTKIFGVNINRL